MSTVVKKDGDQSPPAKKGKISFIILIILLTAVLLFAVGFVHQSIKEQAEQRQWIAHMEETVHIDTFYNGISIDGISLEGKTLDEARALLQQKAEEEMAAMQLTITYNDEVWSFDHRDLDARSDWEVKVTEAYRMARLGSLEDRYQRVLHLQERGLAFETVLAYDIELLRDDIEAIAEGIFVDAVDAEIFFNPGASDKFRITEEHTGLYVDADVLFAELAARVENRSFGTINIEPEVVEPAVYAENLAKATNRITVFSTDLLESSSNRQTNVKLALSKVNGYRIDPGGIFSFNGAVGQRTAARGFKAAPVIMPDKSLQDGIGGGICQSSSTIYNAALMAGMEIVERYHHSFPVAYVPRGLDATVSWGGADLKFRNPNDTPVFLRTYSSGKKVYVELYGESLPRNGKIVLESKLTESVAPPATKMIEDKTGKYVSSAGGQVEYIKSRTGLRVTSYAHYYENGKRVRTETIARDYYRPIQGVTYFRKAAPKKEAAANGTSSTKPDNGTSEESNNE